MYLDGEFYSLYLRKTAYEFKTSLDALDSQILYKTILQPILGIEDLRNGNRIFYSNGKRDSVYVKSNIDSGDFKVGFGMVPITIEELKCIADDGLKINIGKAKRRDIPGAQPKTDQQKEDRSVADTSRRRGAHRQDALDLLRGQTPRQGML